MAMSWNNLQLNIRTGHDQLDLNSSPSSSGKLLVQLQGQMVSVYSNFKIYVY